MSWFFCNKQYFFVINDISENIWWGVQITVDGLLLIFNTIFKESTKKQKQRIEQGTFITVCYTSTHKLVHSVKEKECDVRDACHESEIQGEKHSPWWAEPTQEGLPVCLAGSKMLTYLQRCFSFSPNHSWISMKHSMSLKENKHIDIDTHTHTHTPTEIRNAYRIRAEM